MGKGLKIILSNVMQKKEYSNKNMPGLGKSHYQMLEPVKEHLELNGQENEIAGNTADAVYCLMVLQHILLKITQMIWGLMMMI